MAMAKKTDDVLADLKRVGAVGGSPKTPSISEAIVTEVEIEQGAPGAVLRDLRGERAVEAIDDAVRHLDDAMRAFEGLRESLVHLRRVWEPVSGDEVPSFQAPETPETALDGLERPGAPPMPPNPQGPPEADRGPQDVDPEAIARAREMARRKILGEDIPPEQRKEDEDDVPYVGQTRALPPGMEPEEITIGTVGTIKPSFPAEE